MRFGFTGTGSVEGAGSAPGMGSAWRGEDAAGPGTGREPAGHAGPTEPGGSGEGRAGGEVVDGTRLFSRTLRVVGGLWVAVTIPFVTAVAALSVDSPGAYVFVLIFLSCGAFTAPGLVATWYAASHVRALDRPGAMLGFAALATAFTIGIGMLVGLGTGWRWGNPTGVPAVALAGILHVAGLVTWVRRRSGGRALSVDVVDMATCVLAVTAPLVVLWGPAVAGADAAWFTLPAAAATVCAIAGVYWTLVLLVRMGRGRRRWFEVCSLALATVGTVNAALQTAQGVSGFTLPPAPLVALNGLCFSMYLVIPLNAPHLLRQGLDRLPPQSQIRGARLATVVSLAGMAALWAATLAVADERTWAMPFALVVVSLLLVLVGLRQMAAAQETRRLYRQVEAASAERRRLLTQLLERAADDRRRFAGQLYEQAIAAYTSFSMMAGSDLPAAGSSSAVAQASARVGGDLKRQATSVRELALVIRPLEGERAQPERLGIPIRAYLASVYGDRLPPRLSVEVEEQLVLDWMTETVLLQIVQDALHNVCQHSGATTVDVTIQAADTRVAVRVTDDGVGFDPASVPEGPGITTMRAAAAVTEGTLVITSQPGRGTTVLAHLGPARPDPSPSGRPRRLAAPARSERSPAGGRDTAPPATVLRVVRND